MPNVLGHLRIYQLWASVGMRKAASRVNEAEEVGADESEKEKE